MKDICDSKKTNHTKDKVLSVRITKVQYQALSVRAKKAHAEGFLYVATDLMRIKEKITLIIKDFFLSNDR